MKFGHDRRLGVTPLWFLAVVVSVATAGLGAEPEAVRKQHVVVSGVPDYQPYEFLDDKGNLTGFVTDLTRAIADAMNLDVEFRVMPRAEARKALQSGAVDVMQGAFYTRENDRLLDFSPPHTIVHVAVFVRSGSPMLTSMEELRGKEIIVVEGGATHNLLTSNGLSNRIVPVGSLAEALHLLASGKHDCVLGAKVPGLYSVKALGLEKKVSVSQTLLTLDYCYAAREGDQHVGPFNDGLALLKQNGQYQALYDKWLGPSGPPKVSWEAVFKYTAWVAGPLLIVLAGALLWSQSLKRQVARRTAALHKEIAEREQAQASLRRLSAEQEEAGKEAQANYLRQRVINSILHLSQENLSLDRLLERTLDELLAIPWMGLEARGAIFLVDETAKVLVMSCQRGLPAQVREMCARVPFGRCVCGRAADSGRAVFTDRVSEAHEYRYEGMTGHGHYCVPMVASSGKVLGVINLYLLEGHHRDEREEEFLKAIANALAEMIARLRAEEALRQTEDKLLQSQKMEAIGRLAGGVAHDFNNVLMAILGYTQRLLRQMPQDDPSRAGLAEIEKSGQRAAQLTRQLLAFARKQVLKPEVLDLNAVITGIQPMLQRLLGEDVRITSELSPDPSVISADRTQIEQVLMNLAVNARDAMPSGGQLDLRTVPLVINEADSAHYEGLKPGNYVKLSVVDTGIGMGEEVRANLFEPFFTTKQAHEGTGLGLSMVYGIVKQSSGDIQVQSVLGQGTRFDLFFPQASGTANGTISHEHNHREVEAHECGTETILLVEDENTIRDLTSLELQDRGYTVLKARNAVEALQLCRGAGRIHLMITDVVMPGMSGTALANVIRQHRPDMKVLFMSGYTERNIAFREGLISGSIFMQKPFTAEDLAAKVRETLAVPEDGQGRSCLGRAPN